MQSKNEWDEKNFIFDFVELRGLVYTNIECFAQQGEKSVGINVGYGTASSFESFRLGAEFNWNATDHIRLSPSFDCYFASSTSYVVSADVHYLFPIKTHGRFILCWESLILIS